MTKRQQPRGTFNGVLNSTGVGTVPTASGIVARAGGGQASATQLSNRINSVDTVATAADSVKLPASAVGQTITVVNTTANACQVFGTSPDTINAAATATGVSLPAGKVAEFVCATAGNWRMNLSA